MFSIKEAKETLGNEHNQWQSIMKFVYFACTLSASAYNHDIFSKVCENVRFIEYFLCEATVGITYVCMDSFIKQYTRRYDCNKYMNPLLRGISYGRFLQTTLMILLHAGYVADSIEFLTESFQDPNPWSTCHKINDTNCVPIKDIKVRCHRNITTHFNRTSAYLNYKESFGVSDRAPLTLRVFVLGLVWVLVFIFSSVSQGTIIKIIKLSFVFKSLSTLIVLLFILVTTNNVATVAFSQIVNIPYPSLNEFMSSMKHVCYAYGIGFLGVHDFGAMSAFTMIDTATVVYMSTFTTLAFMRSWVMRMLYLLMKTCVEDDRLYSTHELFYAVFPLATEFIHARQLYVISFYGNTLIGTLVYMTYLMVMLAKFLSYEFRSVKQDYVVGFLSCLGFVLSIPLFALTTQIHRPKALTTGIEIAALYLGSIYMAVVMWMYGLKHFCTDIQFWLGFRPTRFWKICWAFHPVVLFSFAVSEAYLVAQWDHSLMKWLAVGWATFTFLTAAGMNIHAIAGFLMRNNIAGVFTSHTNYGPPEYEDRKRRIYYNEFTRLRKCKHKCLDIDEWYVCNHQKFIYESTLKLSSSSDSESSLVNIYGSESKNEDDGIPLGPPV